jgi:hypothetical protein
MQRDVFPCVRALRGGGESMKTLVLPKVQMFPVAKQRRLDQLLETNSEGTITPGEKSALERLVGEAQELMLANARRLAEYSKGDAARPPAVQFPRSGQIHPTKRRRSVR